MSEWDHEHRATVTLADATAFAVEPALHGVGGDDLLRAFMAISRALNLDHPLSFTLDLIAEKVSQTLRHKYCAILLCHNETKELLIEGAYGLPEEYIRALNSDLKQRVDGDSVMARSVTAQAFRTRMPVYIHDITADRRFRPWREAALRAGYRAIVALPLIFRGEAIGVLNCYDEPRHYSEDQVEALMVVAEQAASAVGIARLVRDQQHTIEQLKILHQRATTQQQLLQRSEEIHEALTELLLEGCSLDELTTTLSELLDAPITLQDAQLNLLACADRPLQEHVELRAHRAGETDTGIVAQLTVLCDLGRTVHVHLFNDQGAPQRALVAHVAGGQYDHAYLTLPLDDARADDPFYARILEQAATVYALYLVKQYVAREAEERIRGDLLTDLLAGRFLDTAEVYDRAHYLGIDLRSASYRLLVAHSAALTTTLERGQRDARSVVHLRGRLLALARGFAAPGGRGMATVIDDHVVMLMRVTAGEAPRCLGERFLATVERALPDLSLRVSVSAPCLSPPDFALRREEAWALLDLAERLASPDPIICYDDWAFYGLLLRGGHRDEVDGLAHRVLDRLIVRDTTAHGDLLITLQAYLDRGLSPRQASAALYVHPNTVTYRLKQIADLLALDLSNLDHLLSIKVALMVRSLAPERFDRLATAQCTTH